MWSRDANAVARVSRQRYPHGPHAPRTTNRLPKSTVPLPSRSFSQPTLLQPWTGLRGTAANVALRGQDGKHVSEVHSTIAVFSEQSVSMTLTSSMSFTNPLESH